MKPPIPLPCGESRNHDMPLAQDVGPNPSVGLCIVAVMCSVLLMLLAFGTISESYSPSCVKTTLWLLISPLPLFVPFADLLRLKNLSGWGLVARCAVTSGIIVWVLAVAVLCVNGAIPQEFGIR